MKKTIVLLCVSISLLCTATKVAYTQSAKVLAGLKNSMGAENITNIPSVSLTQILLIVKLDSALKTDVKPLFPDQYKNIIRLMKKSINRVNTSYCAFSRGKKEKAEKNFFRAMYWYANARMEYDNILVAIGRPPYKETLTRNDLIEMIEAVKQL